MKKLTLLFVFACGVVSLNAQALPKKYVLLEHFTNSRCSVCASRNPAFYNLIANYPDDVRHLSIHPPVPYSNCLIYQANTSENKARADFYDIFGTPRVALNGNLVPTGSSLLPAATLQSALNQTSPITIRVEESGTFPTKTAKITVSSYGTTPSGTYKLYAAVAETTVNYSSPNGESKHHDVFRAMLPNVNGESITLPAAGGSLSFTYNYTYTAPTGWTSNYDSLYVVAFVQNTETNEVLNTGTRFDPVFVSAGEAATPRSVRIQPNPASAEAWASLPGRQAERVEVFSIGGQLVRTVSETQNELVRIPLDALTPGIYIVKITGEDGLFVGKLVKE